MARDDKQTAPPRRDEGGAIEKQKPTIMAVAYDFDGTLAQGNMQETKFIPDIGMTNEEFWERVNGAAAIEQGDRILIYMYYMLKWAREKGVPIRRQDFEERGRNLELFAGVEDWFDRIRRYGEARNVHVEHHIISSGNEEIIAGTNVAPKVDRIYASRFMYDDNGDAVWPALAVNFTTKTQFLFRINKGAHDLSDDAGINKLLPHEERPVPFENMVFIGDGTTDVPAFGLIRDKGGLSISVYDPDMPDGPERARRFQIEGRTHHWAPADYRPGSKLDRLIKANVELVAARQICR